jgi:hypothetical protein
MKTKSDCEVFQTLIFIPKIIGFEKRKETENIQKRNVKKNQGPRN